MKSEDDENGKLFSGGNRSSELNHIREDLHSGGHNTHGFSNNSNMSADDLRRMLKIQNDPATTRKRSMNDSDDNISAKRSEDRPSKLCENNKMLASLLKNPPKNITINTLPVVKTIPDIAPAAATLGRSSAVKSNTTSASMAFVMSSAVPPTLTTATATASATANINNCRLRGHKQSLQQQHQHQHQHHQHQHHHQHHQQQQQLAESYLTLQQQQQSHIGGNILQSSTGSHRSMSINFPATLSSCSSASGVSSSASSVTSPTSNSENYIFTAPSSMLSTTSGVSTMTTSMGNPASSGSAASFEGDSELSKILDSVMDYVVDDQAFASSPPVLTQQQINERMAISAIKKSLMVETSVFGAPATGVGHNPTSQHVIHHSQQQEQQSLGHHHHHIQPQQQQQQHNPHASHHHHHQHHHSQSHPHQHSHHAHHQQQQHHHPLHHSHHTHSHSHGHQQQQPHHQHYGQHNPSQQPPAYPGNSISNMTPQQQQQQQMQLMRMQMLENIRMNSNQNFQRPPPNYPARGRAAATAGSGLPRVSGGVMGGNIGVGNQAGGINSSPSGNTSGGNNVSGSNVAANPNQYKYRTLAQQQLVAQQKERLLQQQQKQHMLVPENATARNDQLCK